MALVIYESCSTIKNDPSREISPSPLFLSSQKENLQPSTLNDSANLRAGYAGATVSSNGQLRGFVKDPGPLWIKLKIMGLLIMI